MTIVLVGGLGHFLFHSVGSNHPDFQSMIFQRDGSTINQFIFHMWHGEKMDDVPMGDSHPFVGIYIPILSYGMDDIAPDIPCLDHGRKWLPLKKWREIDK